MRSRMVPWSMTSTASSLKMEESSSMEPAICAISVSLDCKKLSSTMSAVSIASCLSGLSGGVWLSSRLMPNCSSVCACPPRFWACTSARYLRCFCRNSADSSCSFFARLRCTFAPMTESSPPAIRVAVPTLFSSRSACRKRSVMSFVICSIWISMCSRSLPKIVPTRFACIDCRLDISLTMSLISLWIKSTSSTHAGGSRPSSTLMFCLSPSSIKYDEC
mmetsp:Transcript_2240/g.3148  ORF Transcript_2240/g.3148 Transcript_2240/m.3148 type:complete len:219 (+) Transcript_2240:122-778(+)